MTLAIAIWIPLIVTVAVAVLLRRFAGAERAALWGGLALSLGFFIGWQILVGPAWIPRTAHDRIGHLVLGGVIVGAAIDAAGDRAALRYALATVYVAVCAWMSATGTLLVKAVPALPILITAGVLAAAWVLAIARLSVLRRDNATLGTVVIVLLAGVFSAAVIAGDAVVAKATVAMASAMIGFVIWQRLFGAATPAILLLTSTAVIFGGSWALIDRAAGLAPGLAVLLFVLFADDTAGRVPMPKGRVSSVLYILTLLGICAIPVLLSAIIVAAALSP